MLVIKALVLLGILITIKLLKGFGYNFYDELVWPNDILYVHFFIILGIISLIVFLTVFKFFGLSIRFNMFFTLLEILPEWYFFPTFNILRMLSDKFLEVLLYFIIF